MACKAFTGKAPFYGIAPITVAVRVLDGKRPPRPTHQDLTNHLWEMVQRCWSRDPQHRPDISEVILCLRTTPALRHDRPHASDNSTLDDTTLETGRQWKLPIGEFPPVAREKLITSLIERVALPAVLLGTRLLHPPATPKIISPIYLRRGARRGRSAKGARKGHE